MDLNLFSTRMNTAMAAVRKCALTLLNVKRLRNPNFVTGKHIAVY